MKKDSKPAPFEKSENDTEPKEMKEGTKHEETMDHKQMRAPQKMQKKNRACVI